MVCPTVECEKAFTARECGTQQREQLRELSHQRSSSDMEVPDAASSAVVIKSTPPAAASMTRIDKENLSLADRIRSPALDTSHSKDQWRTIAIQAAARANGDVYEEWKEPLPASRLDLQPEGWQIMNGMNGALVGQASTIHDQAAVLSLRQSSAGSASQSVHPCDAPTVSAIDCKPDSSTCKQEVSLVIVDAQQPVATLGIVLKSHASTTAPPCSSERPVQPQAPADEADAGIPSESVADPNSAHESPAAPESSAQPVMPLGRALQTAGCSSATNKAVAEEHMEPQAGHMSAPAVASLADECSEAVTAESKGTNKPSPAGCVPATHQIVADNWVDPKADRKQPADIVPAPQLDLDDGEVQWKNASMPPAHRRQLSGQSSKGSALSGNPYASSCGGSRAGSMAGSPAGSQEIPEHSQATQQQNLSGNPFAPPGTLRSRPVSPFAEPAPCHGRSLSLHAPDLPVPTSAALAEYPSSLSLPYTSHTALTGAQLYQMQQSPMPEEGESFRPAKDILLELFLTRASRPQMTGSRAAPPDGVTGKGMETPQVAMEAEQSLQAETAHSSSSHDGQQRSQEHITDQRECPAEKHEDQQAAAEELRQVLDCDERAQSWDAMWGAASCEGLTTAAISEVLPEDGVLSEGPSDSWGPAGAKLAQSRWEAAWAGSFAPGVPDQAGNSAPAEPEQYAAWEPDWDSSQALLQQQEFMLLLPSREPPPPPAPAGVGAPSMAQHVHGAAQRECVLPVMRPEDRQKCERFYAQGFADKGGITASAAQPLHAKSGCWVSFDTIWQLVSPDTVSFSLDCSSFCLFMHLLKTSMKGIQLPISISKEQARDLLGVFSAADTAAADSQPAGQDTTEAAACSMAEAGAERPRQAHARGFSFFQPFQSGMQQGTLSRRPSTADSPSRSYHPQFNSGAPLSLTRPASAASESSASHLSPGVSPCGALVAKAVREANREGAGQVWQPLASRQLDSWAHTSAPAHALSAPATQLHAPQGELRRHLTDIPSPQRVCPTLPSPRSSEGSPDSHAGGHTQRPSHASAQVSERVNITVNGAKVEYSKSLDRPFFSMSLHDASGKRLEPVQDTPPGHFDRRTFIITAGHDLQFKTPMRQIPPESVVYIEVKHWKPASKKMSTLGWSFAPIEMFVDTSSENTAARAGQLFLHLYKKPLSYTAHARNSQLKQLRSKGHDLYLTLR